MKKRLFFLAILVFSFWGPSSQVRAATLTLAEEVATPAAQPTVGVKEKITEPTSEEAKEKFAAVLTEQRLGSVGPTNFLKHAIRLAVHNGVPANTIILILLLPFIGTLVGFLQYLVGLSGFGIFMPAMIATTFLATEIAGGLILFAIILLATIFTGKILQGVHLYYWPRRAITLMSISLITFLFLLTAPFLGLSELTKISIFPILFLILLAEEFSRTQLGKSKSRAISLTLGTLIISMIGTSLMNWEVIQKLILLNPEMSFLLVLATNILIGKYGGWRLLEYRRFRSILEK